MTVTTTYNGMVIHDDIERELVRLREFGIDAQVEGLSRDDLDCTFKPLGWFGREDGVWTIRLSPTADVTEQWNVLRRMWDAITHREHRLWDDHGYGTGLIVGADKSLIRLNDDPTGWRRTFERAISEKVADLIRTELSKLTPELASHRWRLLDTAGTDSTRERFVGARFLDSHVGEIAAEIRAEMARQMRRVEDLAQALDLSTPTVRKSLKGTRVLSGRELKSICDWLDVDVEDLIAKPYREADRAGLIFDDEDVAS